MIVQRWQEFSGGTAVLDGDGRSYEDIAGSGCDGEASGDEPTDSAQVGAKAPAHRALRSTGPPPVRTAP